MACDEEPSRQHGYPRMRLEEMRRMRWVPDTTWMSCAAFSNAEDVAPWQYNILASSDGTDTTKQTNAAVSTTAATTTVAPSSIITPSSTIAPSTTAITPFTTPVTSITPCSTAITPPTTTSLSPPPLSSRPLPLSHSLSPPLQAESTLQLLQDIPSPYESYRAHVSATGSGTPEGAVITPSDTTSSMFDVDEDEGRTVDTSQSVSSLPSIQTETSGLMHLTPDQAPYQGDDLPVSGTLLYHNITPEPPYEYSQRHSSQDTSEGRGLAIIDATELSFETGDAIYVATPIPLSQSTPDLPAPARDEIPVSAAPSEYNRIPTTYNASPSQQLSFETPQGQDHKASSHGSEDAKTYILSKGAPQSSSRVSPFRSPGPTTRYNTRRQAAQRLAQNDDDDDSDTGSEPQGSESHLGRANLHSDKDYCLSDIEVEDIGPEGDDSDSEDQSSRKRRKVLRSSAGLLRDATASVERPRRGRPSLRLRSTKSTYRGKYAQAIGILSPASSQTTFDETEVRAVLASFEEWPLETASLKRITENGKTTFQVQFDWTPYTKHGHTSSTARDRVDLPSTRTRSRAKRASAPRTKYTPQEDELLIELKDGREMLVWPEIHQRFSEAHPGRSVESLQVHYSTKLKSRKRL